jgi:hypothetical protein
VAYAHCERICCTRATTAIAKPWKQQLLQYNRPLDRKSHGRNMYYSCRIHLHCSLSLSFSLHLFVWISHGRGIPLRTA